MRKTLLLWFFMLLNILTYSACGSKSTAQHGDLRTSKSQMQPKYMYGVIMGSNQIGNQRTIPRLQVIHRRSLSHSAKPVNGGSNDIRHPNNGRRSSNSFCIKPSSLFMAALKNLVLGLLLFVCFY